MSYPNQLVLGTRRQVAAVGAKAHAPDVEIGRHVGGAVVLEDAHLFARLDVKDLGRLVAAGGDVLAVVAEPDAADDALVGERVDQVDVEDALDLRVEDGIPVVARLLVVRCHGVDLEVAQRVADGRGRGAGAAHASVVRRRVAHLRGLSIAGIGDGGVDLGRGRPDSIRRPADAPAARARRCGAWRRLRAHAVGHGALGIGLLLVGRLLLGLLLLLLLLCVGVRGGNRQSWRALGHLVVVRAHLLVLRRSLGLRRRETSLISAGHYSAKEAVSRRNRWRLLRGPSVLRRPLEARLRRSLAGHLELVPQHVDFFFISIKNGKRNG